MSERGVKQTRMLAMHTHVYTHTCVCARTHRCMHVHTHTHTYCGELRQRLYLSLLIFFEHDIGNFLYNVTDSIDYHCNLRILHIIRPDLQWGGEGEAI